MNHNNKKQGGYIALMATIIISLILLVMAVKASSSGWSSRFNVLGTEAKEQANDLAEGCAEQALATLLTDPTYVGDVTITKDEGSCHIFPILVNFPPGLVTVKTQAVVRNSYANLDMAMAIHDLHLTSIPTAPTTGTLFVTTHVINDSSGTKQANEFTMNVSAVNPVDPFDGSESGVIVSVQPGPFSVNGSTLSNYSMNIGSNCSGNVIAGEIKFCTITYDDITTTLTVLANVTNNDSGNKLPSDFPLFIDGVSVTLGQPKTVTAGGHTVSATTLSGYGASSWGYDCNSSGNITMTLGQNKTCIINFDDLVPPAPTCADTVMMLDRTSSMFYTDPMNQSTYRTDWINDEAAAANSLVTLYSVLTPHPQISVGHFADVAKLWLTQSDANNTSAEIVSHLSSNYNNLPTTIGNALQNVTTFFLGIPIQYAFTNLSAVISKADAELNNTSYHIAGKAKVLILVSDGGANEPGGKLADGYAVNQTALDAATSAATAAKSATGAGKAPDNIPTQIYTIHFGDTSGLTFLASLATNSAVNYITTPNDTGFLSPSSNSVDSGTGWSSPTSAYGSGGSSATDTGNHMQRYYNFNIPTIPSGSIINGIEAKAVASVTDSPLVTNTPNLAPAALGSYNYWSANTGSAVNAISSSDNDTTYIDEADNQTFAFQGANVPAGVTINSVTLNAVAESFNGTTATMRLIAENGGTPVNDSGHSLTASYSPYSWTMNTNPITGSAWTVSEVNNWTTKFGVQKTNNGASIPRVTQMWLVVSYSTSGSTGYISPSGQSADGTGFNNPTNAYSDGGSSAATAKNNYRNRFTYTMPSLPAGASITGIQVRPDWWLDSTSGTNSVDVELSWNGGTTWTSKKNESTESTNDTNNKTLGGSTDNWGHTWSISDISSTNFRVRITANSSSSSRTISLDWIPVNVFYAIPGVPSNLTPTAPGSYNYWLANTGSAVNAVNGNDGDTTYIDEADKQTFAFAGAGVPSNATVNSVTLNVVAKSYNGSSATMQLITENGSNQTNDNGHSLSTSYATYQYNNGPMTINPLTGSAWTVSEVNNWTTKFGVQKTSNGTSVPRVTQMYLTVSYSTPTTLSTTCQLGVDLSYDGGSHWVSPQKTQTLTSTLTQLPSFGGSTDNWYRTWAPGDFSNSNFRVRVQDIDPGIGCNSNAVTNLDWLQARVYYSTTTIDTATENTDGDNFYISPTSADMAGIFTDIGKRVCPSNQIVTPPDPPTKGTLMIMTKVNNNNGGSKTESNFTVKVTGDSPSQTSFAGSSAGTSVTVDPGAYNVTENSMSGYIFTPGATCSSSGSLGNIVAGETRVCILNNDDIPPPPPPPDLNFDPNSWHEVPTAN